MTKLEDYIGGLVASLTSARVLSDMQTVKVAEQYNNHDLLRHFAVPRMRLDEVELTVPVAMDKVEQPEGEAAAFDNTAFNSKVYQELLTYYGLNSLPNDLSQKVRSEIAALTRKLEDSITGQGTYTLAKYVEELQLVARIIEEEMKERINRIEEEFRVYFERELAAALVTMNDDELAELCVIVESHKLREIAPENLIYIKIKVNEEGMEWDRLEDSDGNVQSRLLPE